MGLFCWWSFGFFWVIFANKNGGVWLFFTAKVRFVSFLLFGVVGCDLDCESCRGVF